MITSTPIRGGKYDTPLTFRIYGLHLSYGRGQLRILGVCDKQKDSQGEEKVQVCGRDDYVAVAVNNAGNAVAVKIWIRDQCLHVGFVALQPGENVSTPRRRWERYKRCAGFPETPRSPAAEASRPGRPLKSARGSMNRCHPLHRTKQAAVKPSICALGKIMRCSAPSIPHKAVL